LDTEGYEGIQGFPEKRKAQQTREGDVVTRRGTMKLFKKNEKALMPRNRELIKENVNIQTNYENMTPEALIAFTIDRAGSIDIEVMERIMAMRDRIEEEKAQKAYYRDLAAFQGECQVIQKTRVAHGKKFDYMYAPREDIAPIMNPILKKYGFSYTFKGQYTTEPPGEEVICTLHHKDGHSESSTFWAPIDEGLFMNDIQKHATSRSYAQRYSLIGVTGITIGGEDTDGIVEEKEIEEKLETGKKRITELIADSIITASERTKITKQVEEAGTIEGLKALWQHWNKEIKDRKAAVEQEKKPEQGELV